MRKSWERESLAAKVCVCARIRQRESGETSFGNGSEFKIPPTTHLGSFQWSPGSRLGLWQFLEGTLNVKA